MNLVVFQEKQKDVVRLALQSDGSGGVDLQIVDEDGRVQFLLLRITEQGKVFRYHGVPEMLGFSLDSIGRLELAETAMPEVDRGFDAFRREGGKFGE